MPLLTRWIPAALLLIIAGVSVWFMTDEIKTRFLRRAAIENINFPASIPASASADRLDALATRALETSPLQIRLAEKATKNSIQKDPRRTSNWNRLAYIDVAQNGKLTAKGILALRESFYLSPYGEVEDMMWRLELANSFWDELPEDLQTQSLSQITALSMTDWDSRQWLIRFVRKSHPDIRTRIERAIGKTRN